MKYRNITQQQVRELFDYKDGLLYWKVSLNRRIMIGSIVGSVVMQHGGKRRFINFNKMRFRAAQLIFLWHHGYIPLIVDHEDRNCLNDKIGNLREATHAQNLINSIKYPNSNNKYKGVFTAKTSKNFYARINFNRKNIHLGSHKTEELAALAYNRAAVKYYGDFANLNIIQP